MSVKELQKMAKKYDGRVAQLLSIGRDKLMRTDRDSYIKRFGFTQADVPQLLQLASDMEIYKHDYSNIPEDEGLEFFGVIHAWYTLSELKAIEFKKMLLRMVEAGDENEYDDWVLDGFVELIKPYRKDMYNYFAEGAIEEQKNTWTRLCYIDAIKEMLKADEVSFQKVEKLIVEVLSHGENPIVNASVIAICMDYKLIEYHGLIKECYARDAVDLMHHGDLEDVEIRMGLREQRETEKEQTMLQKLFNGLDDNFDDKELPYVRETLKVGRNEPCPCGSGKKYKKCCLNK
jgi:hypothetical protein